jgi:hypothetical protein
VEQKQKTSSKKRSHEEMNKGKDEDEDDVLKVDTRKLMKILPDQLPGESLYSYQKRLAEATQNILRSSELKHRPALREKRKE